jgi:hypothetical protein
MAIIISRQKECAIAAGNPAFFLSFLHCFAMIREKETHKEGKKQC